MADKPKRSWRDDPKVVRLTEEILRLHEAQKLHEKEAAVAERLQQVAQVRPVSELQGDVEHDLAPSPQASYEELVAQLLHQLRVTDKELRQLHERRDELEPGQFEALRDELLAHVARLTKALER